MITLYFGTETDDTCNVCDNCTWGIQLNQKDFAELCRVIVNCVKHMILFEEKDSAEELVHTLMGSQSAKVRKHKFSQLPGHGACKGRIKSKELTHLVHYLIVKGFLCESR